MGCRKDVTRGDDGMKIRWMDWREQSCASSA